MGISPLSAKIRRIFGREDAGSVWGKAILAAFYLQFLRFKGHGPFQNIKPTSKNTSELLSTLPARYAIVRNTLYRKALCFMD
jgi:hypothetical protein